MVGIVLLGAGVASADVAPPPEADCSSKAVGTGCRIDGAPGTCQESTCSRLDYSSAGGPPASVTYDCLECIAGGTPPSDDDDGCAVSGTGRTSGALALVLGASLLVFRRRRR